MPHIGCITVCVRFDDYLEHTLARYVETFDAVAVVTTPEDEATQALCARFPSVQVVRSTRARDRGEAFNLPALINDGYRALAPTAWAVKMDPDILLPANARQVMDAALDDPELLWGSRRYFCETIEIMDRFVATGDYGVLEPPYETTADVLGFLQLFHVASSAMRGRDAPYEEARFEGPSRTNDRLFSERWGDRRRWLDFDVVHLGLDAIGTNWKGRKAPSFRRGAAPG